MEELRGARKVSLATRVIRNELVKRRDLYNGYLASIESALKEAKPYTKERDLAVAILDRVLGEEGSVC